jgi:hypothetical protein
VTRLHRLQPSQCYLNEPIPFINHAIEHLRRQARFYFTPGYFAPTPTHKQPFPHNKSKYLPYTVTTSYKSTVPLSFPFPPVSLARRHPSPSWVAPRRRPKMGWIKKQPSEMRILTNCSVWTKRTSIEQSRFFCWVSGYSASILQLTTRSMTDHYFLQGLANPENLQSSSRCASFTMVDFP